MSVAPPPEPVRLRTWQGVTLGSLFVGYAGYYVCRSVLPVVSNRMIADPTLGLDDAGYGHLLTVGIVMYAVGKVAGGVFAGLVSARTLFLAGMALSAACVAAFGLAGGLAAVFAVWGANRLVQAQGWAGLVAIARRWSAPVARGRVMGFLTLSYLFGDSLARLYLGAFIKWGLGWRAVAWVAAGTLAALFAVGVFLLRPSPAAVGLPEFEPEPPPARPQLADILARLFTRPAFVLVCGMNAGLTAVREAFNSWTPRYLETEVGLPPEDCGLLSALFPFAGAVAAVLAGFAVDRLRGRFGGLTVGLLAAGVLTMLAVAVLDFRDRPVLALAVTSAVALFIMGPYTFCSGALAQKLGGSAGAGVAANLMDAAGYAVGAVVSGVLAGWLVKQFGFAPLLWVLLGLLVFTLLAAAAFWRDEQVRSRDPSGSASG